MGGGRWRGLPPFNVRRGSAYNHFVLKCLQKTIKKSLQNHSKSGIIKVQKTAERGINMNEKITIETSAYMAIFFKHSIQERITQIAKEMQKRKKYLDAHGKSTEDDKAYQRCKAAAMFWNNELDKMINLLNPGEEY